MVMMESRVRGLVTPKKKGVDQKHDRRIGLKNDVDLCCTE